MSGEKVTTQNFESELWDEFSGNAPDERPGGEYEDLPPKAWILAKTATLDNGKAAPEIRTQTYTDKNTGEEKEILKFSVGLIAVGGEDKLTDPAKHNGRMVWYDAFLLPGPKEGDGKPLSGRFTAFLNALFSPGIGQGMDPKDVKRSEVRWRHTIQELRKIHEQNPDITLDSYSGTPQEKKARFLAGMTVKALEDESRSLLFKTRPSSYKSRKTGETVNKIEVGMIEDNTPGNRQARRVAVFDNNSDVAW